MKPLHVCLEPTDMIYLDSISVIKDDLCLVGFMIVRILILDWKKLLLVLKVWGLNAVKVAVLVIFIIYVSADWLFIRFMWEISQTLKYIQNMIKYEGEKHQIFSF